MDQPPDLGEIYALAAPALGRQLEQYRESANRYQRKSKAEATWHGYNCVWRLAQRFALVHDVCALPMATDTARALFSDMADKGYSSSYINQMAVVLRHVHRWSSAPDPLIDPDVIDTLKGVKRVAGERPVKRKWAIQPDELALLADVDDKQERCALLLCFAAALRRKELVALDPEDVEITAEGALITVGKSKTDQQSRGAELFIERGTRMCPIRALEEWLAVRGTDPGPLFYNQKRGTTPRHRLSDRTVARWIQRGAKRIGLNPKDFGGHSMRSGCATALIVAGVADPQILAHTRHASIDSLAPYFRPRGKMRVNLTAALDL
jgi:integrase